MPVEKEATTVKEISWRRDLHRNAGIEGRPQCLFCLGGGDGDKLHIFAVLETDRSIPDLIRKFCIFDQRGANYTLVFAVFTITMKYLSKAFAFIFTIIFNIFFNLFFYLMVLHKGENNWLAIQSTISLSLINKSAHKVLDGTCTSCLDCVHTWSL